MLSQTSIISSLPRTLRMVGMIGSGRHASNVAGRSPRQREEPEARACPVSSHNEWDPLEEVIVGRPEGARIPSLTPEIKASEKPYHWEWFAKYAGQAHEPDRLKRASAQVEEFCRVLEMEGVTVRRPEMFSWLENGDCTTPDFTEGGLHMACPRDSMIVIGNEIIEAPMSWRSRYFETRPYKKLLNEYFKEGAKWTLAPKPTMGDNIYNQDFPYDDMVKRREMSDEGKFGLTEEEICFDAADIFRAGRDIFMQISQVTNWSGFEWVKRHLSPEYRVHSLNMDDPYAFHIDCSLMPLRPGLLLANPDRPCFQAEIFRKAGWDIIQAPRPINTEANLFTSSWLSINILSLDEERVIVYNKEKPIIDLLKRLGMTPIPLDFTDAFHWGGAFHCWSLDIRRRGELKSYFNW